MKGQIKAGKGNFVGNAGEYYVMAELLKRGIIAALAPRNTPSFDILATQNDITCRIRVKTKSEEYDIWVWNANNEGIIFKDLHVDGDFTVLVNLTQDTHQLEYFVIPTNILNTWLVSDFQKWAETPGKNNQERNKLTKYRNLGQKRDSQRIIEFYNNWGILWQ